jgi:heavy-metal resistance protein
VIALPRFSRGLVVTFVAAALASVVVSAQRRGGGGGTGGSAPPNRLDTLVTFLTLDKDQKNKAKAILDTAHKGAAPIRDQLSQSRTAIMAAIQAGKSQAEIDAAVKDYAAAAAAMAEAETKALAEIARGLTEQQRVNSAATQSALSLMRSIFLDAKKWNTVPDGRGY